MRTTIQIIFPTEGDRWEFNYEGAQVVPVPEVGEQLMAMTLGGVAMVVDYRLFSYSADQVTVRLVCKMPEHFLKPPNAVNHGTVTQKATLLSRLPGLFGRVSRQS